MPRERAAALLEYLGEGSRVEVLEEMNTSEAAEIITEMTPDDRADIIEELEEERADEILSEIPAAERAETERLAMEVRRRGVSITAVVTNRVTSATALPVAEVPLHFEAPLTAAPTGVDVLRDWGNSWRSR